MPMMAFELKRGPANVGPRVAYPQFEPDCAHSDCTESGSNPTSAHRLPSWSAWEIHTDPRIPQPWWSLGGQQCLRLFKTTTRVDPSRFTWQNTCQMAYNNELGNDSQDLVATMQSNTQAFRCTQFCGEESDDSCWLRESLLFVFKCRSCRPFVCLLGPKYCNFNLVDVSHYAAASFLTTPQPWRIPVGRGLQTKFVTLTSLASPWRPLSSRTPRIGGGFAKRVEYYRQGKLASANVNAWSLSSVRHTLRKANGWNSEHSITWIGTVDCNCSFF